MFFNHVSTFDDDLAFFWAYRQNFAFFTLIFTRQDNNGVTCFNVYVHS